MKDLLSMAFANAVTLMLNSEGWCATRVFFADKSTKDANGRTDDTTLLV
jgi:hypothetical protein